MIGFPKSTTILANWKAEVNIFEKTNQLKELKAEWFNYRNGLYPDFVTSLKPDDVPENIPIFSFHNVSAEELSQKLHYLKVNRYSTINSDEYLYLNGKSRNERLVMLTFDDGLSSLASVVYPALQQFGMKAVAFVLPGEIEAFGNKRIMHDNGQEDPLLASWDELAQMSDFVDIQSHSHYHWLIYTSSKVSVFFTPAIAKSWQKIDWPIPFQNGSDNPARELRYGTPIYTTNSRLSGERRVFEDESISRACADFVEEMGGEAFFKNNDWLATLTRFHAEAAKRGNYGQEEEDERLREIKNCFYDSKRLIEEKLDKVVRHFCFPFGIGSAEAERIASEAGYAAVYYGVKANFNIHDPGNDNTIRRITRIKDDYLYRLPGEDRWPLTKIFWKKAERRLSYHFLRRGKVR